MKTFTVEYGDQPLDLSLPPWTDARGMRSAPPALAPPAAYAEALQQPIGGPPLREIAAARLRAQPDGEAVIVVSDNTRPVPYHGTDGMVLPLLQTLLEAGYPQEQIVIMIGAGSHRNMEAEEIEAMLGLQAAGFSAVQVINHEYDRPEQLVSLGTTHRGSAVAINRRYYGAGLKIVTGLVESHFMAGASGGRKGICPGIVGKQTLEIFHGARLLSSSQAADLVLEGNPLHDESLEVARMAGCDFLLNVTLDADKQLTGVFAGDLVEAHRAAVSFIRSYVTVPLPHRYDIVLIPAGFVGVNHYQAAKAAIEAARAVRRGGHIIVLARHSDPDPVGGAGYKAALDLLQQKGLQGFMETISAAGWQMIPEQWQVQMWCKVLEVIGSPDHLWHCAVEIPPEAYHRLPGQAAVKLLDEAELQLPATAQMQRMTTYALRQALAACEAPDPAILLLKDGPYGIPELTD